jgi:hypothetical protein
MTMAAAVDARGPSSSKTGHTTGDDVEHAGTRRRWQAPPSTRKQEEIMNDIDKYMIPLDSIRSVSVGGVMVMIFLALVIGAFAALIVGGVTCNQSDAVAYIAATPTAIITMALACCLMAHTGFEKSIDTSKINDEYGITVTSIKRTDNQDGMETHRVSYLHDGALVNGTMLIKDGKVGLFAGKGDKLTPVKPKSVADASAAPTTSKATDSHANASKPNKSARSRGGCYAKSYNNDGSIRELAGDCPATVAY